MFLYEVSGNKYVKKDFSQDSVMTGKQIIHAGSIQNKNGLLKMPVELYSYNKNGQQTDNTRTVYSCNPDQKTILLNIFPFTDYGSGSEIKVEVQGTNELYPVNPEPGQTIESLRFEMI